jgi:hypothetical protein
LMGSSDAATGTGSDAGSMELDGSQAAIDTGGVMNGDAASEDSPMDAGSDASTDGAQDGSTCAECDGCSETDSSCEKPSDASPDAQHAEGQ